MHVYAFGSVTRGEIDIYSDIDLLAITNDSSQLNPDKFSVYSPEKIISFWKQGNPFAWHLYYEAELIYSLDRKDFIKNMGEPEEYLTGIKDCQKFFKIFKKAVSSIDDKNSLIFDLSTIYLSTRNFATCFSLSMKKVNFSRRAALNLDEFSLNIPTDVYLLYERARILSSREVGNGLSLNELSCAVAYLPILESWFGKVMQYISRKSYERV